MNKETALRLLKDINLCIDDSFYDISEERFLTVLKNYIEVEE